MWLHHLRRTHAPTCCVLARARVRACDSAPTHPRRHMRAHSRRRWTACGSARRRSPRRHRSTRTSAHGTRRVSPRCPMYAPPFRPWRRVNRGFVRSRARADEALICGMCASAARSLRKAIHRWNARTQYMYTQCMHESISMRVWLHRRTPMRARRTHAPTCCVLSCVMHRR
jgi:hypothetical protein